MVRGVKSLKFLLLIIKQKKKIDSSTQQSWLDIRDRVQALSIFYLPFQNIFFEYGQCWFLPLCDCIDSLGV